MSITKVSVSRGFTANVGNYESMRFDVGCEVARDDGQTADDAALIAADFAQRHLDMLIWEHVPVECPEDLAPEFKEASDALGYGERERTPLRKSKPRKAWETALADLLQLVEEAART